MEDFLKIFLFKKIIIIKTHLKYVLHAYTQKDFYIEIRNKVFLVMYDLKK